MSPTSSPTKTARRAPWYVSSRHTHSQCYQHPSNEIQAIAVNAEGIAVCWNVAIGSNNEFIGITPAFTFADGACCKGTLTSAAYSAEYHKLYLVSQGKTVTEIDATATRCPVTAAALTALNCGEALPTSALKSVTIAGATITDVCEPWSPMLDDTFVPVVCDVGDDRERDA